MLTHAIEAIYLAGSKAIHKHVHASLHVDTQTHQDAEVNRFLLTNVCFFLNHSASCILLLVCMYANPRHFFLHLAWSLVLTLYVLAFRECLLFVRCLPTQQLE
jgi:hypothetical protein